MFRWIWILIPVLLSPDASAQHRPNVVVIMTDDQGFANIGATGHPFLKTPHIDSLYEHSVRFTDFHQEMLCSPSRAALLTGRYSARTGAWRTSAGRGMMKAGEITLAEVFGEHGYATGMFGKWHLGENYPFRPQDQGFEEVVHHKSGGVGQLSDYWGNDYFDDTYFHNGEPRQFEGYSTDVWFREAERFIERNKRNPFFVYLAPNAAHRPFNIEEEYARPYLDKGLSEQTANYYGMIANLDENIGRFLRFLEREELRRNTILVFTTDDGPAGGAEWSRYKETGNGILFDNSADFLQSGGFPVQGYNAGLRGKKSSAYEGGHKVFALLQWPAGGLAEGKDLNGLTGVWDLMPTLLDLSNIVPGKEIAFDGISLKPLLYGRSLPAFTERTLIVQLHGGVFAAHLKGVPHRYWESAVMRGRWRLVNGQKLYDTVRDPMQTRNLVHEFPKVVAELRSAYEKWYREVTAMINEPARIIIGSEKENPVVLTPHSSYTENGNPAGAKQSTVLKLQTGAYGPWKVEVARSGTYNVKLSRYPLYTRKPMGYHFYTGKKDFEIRKAMLHAGNQRLVREITPDNPFAKFRLRLTEGNRDLQGWLIDDRGEVFPAYFAEIEKEH